MAVELIGVIQRWNGLSTDTKPTDGVKIGSEFYETDTKALYVYTAAGWVTKPQPTVLTGSNAFIAGNPYVVETDCVAADTNYDIDVNANLGRNAHFGLLTSKSTNAGTVQVAISYNGVAFSGFFTELLPGATLTLDGLDIDTIRVKSSVAGDDVIMGVW